MALSCRVRSLSAQIAGLSPKPKPDRRHPADGFCAAVVRASPAPCTRERRAAEIPGRSRPPSAATPEPGSAPTHPGAHRHRQRRGLIGQDQRRRADHPGHQHRFGADPGDEQDAEIGRGPDLRRAGKAQPRYHQQRGGGAPDPGRADMVRPVAAQSASVARSKMARQACRRPETAAPRSWASATIRASRSACGSPRWPAAKRSRRTPEPRAQLSICHGGVMPLHTGSDVWFARRAAGSSERTLARPVRRAPGLSSRRTGRG